MRSPAEPGDATVLETPAVAWMTRPRDVAEALDGEADGILPLLRPAAESRRQRWLDALSAGTCPSTESPRLGGGGAGDVLLCLEPELEEVAAAWGRRTGRPAVTLRSEADVEREAYALAAGGADSLLVVGRVQRIPYRSRRDLHRSLGIPFGWVVGSDLEALVFQLAKIRRSIGTPDHGWFVLDAIRERVKAYLQRDDGWIRIASSLPDDEDIGRYVADHGGTLNVLRAHGRGDHAHFDDIVACGLLGRRELDPSGRPVPGGCRDDETGRFCKKSGDHHPRVLRFADLSAPIVGLLTCAGAAMPGELYPSDSSAVLAPLESAAAHVLASMDVFKSQDWHASLILQRYLAGDSLGEIVTGLNDLQESYQEGEFPERPFCLFGDPAVRRIGAPAVAEPDIPLRLLRSCDSESVETVPDYGGGTLALQGGGLLLVVGEADSPVVERAEELRRAQHLTALRVDRCRRIEWLEAAIRARYAGRLHDNEGFRDDLNQLSGLRAGLLHALQRLAEWLEVARRRCAWNERITARLDWVESAVVAWDRHFAQMALEHLFTDNSHHLLLDGLQRRETPLARACEFCGRPLRLTRAMDIALDRVAAERLACTLCSSLSAWTVGGPGPIRASWPTHCRVEDVLSLELESPAEETGDPLPIHCGLSVFTPGPFNEAVTTSFEVRGRKKSLQIEVPAGCSPSAHALQLVAVQNLGIALYRRLVAVRRTPSDDPDMEKLR